MSLNSPSKRSTHKINSSSPKASFNKDIENLMTQNIKFAKKKKSSLSSRQKLSFKLANQLFKINENVQLIDQKSISDDELV